MLTECARTTPCWSSSKHFSARVGLGCSVQCNVQRRAGASGRPNNLKSCSAKFKSSKFNFVALSNPTRCRLEAISPGSSSVSGWLRVVGRSSESAFVMDRRRAQFVDVSVLLPRCTGGSSVDAIACGRAHYYSGWALRGRETEHGAGCYLRVKQCAMSGVRQERNNERTNENETKTISLL